MARSSTDSSRTTFPYLVTTVGVGLMAVSQIYSYVRAMMFRAMFHPGSGGGPGYTGMRQFGGGFGFPNVLSILALAIAIAGLVWLGLVLKRRKSVKPT